MTTTPGRSDASFLAPPGAVADWRGVLLTAAAEDAGLLAQLPATAEGAAAGTGCDPFSTRVVLDALVTLDVLSLDDRSRYVPGPAMPSDDDAAVLAHHARAVGQWAAGLGPRLRGEPTQPGRRRRSPEELARWYDALANGARPRAGGVVDACLAAVPGATAVLDLGGGHGEYAAAFARRGCAVTLQDLPAGIDAIRDRPAITDHDITLVARDVFDGVAEGSFDLVLCAGLTHIFDAARNAELARALAASVPTGGAVAIHTFLRGLDPMAPLFAVQMLVAGNGDTHSLEAYTSWYGDAGFGPPELVDVTGGERRLMIFARR